MGIQGIRILDCRADFAVHYLRVVGEFEFKFANAYRNNAHVQGARTTGRSNCGGYAELILEKRLEAIDVVATQITPSVGCHVGGIGYF